MCLCCVNICFFFHSRIGRKASHHHTVRERKGGKKNPVLDQLLMMPIKQVKGKAPILRIEWTHLGIDPKLGVVGLVVMISTIYHSRSTNPMGGLLHPHRRNHTQITRTLLVVTTSRLSPHEGTIMVTHHRTQNIHPAQRSMGFRRQDLPPATPMFGSGIVSWTCMSDFVVPLPVDYDCPLGMDSACRFIPFNSCLSLRLYVLQFLLVLTLSKLSLALGSSSWLVQSSYCCKSANSLSAFLELYEREGRHFCITDAALQMTSFLMHRRCFCKCMGTKNCSCAS